MRLTLTKLVDGAIQEAGFDIPDTHMTTVIELLEADADATAGRTRAQGIEARRTSNERADEILLERAKLAKKGKK